MASEEQKPEKKRKEDHVIFVGGKSQFMNYVTACVMQLSKGSDEIEVRARGKFISRAVDVVEVTRNRFVQNLEVADIQIGSEDFKNKDGKDVRVSAINIRLKKKK